MQLVPGARGRALVLAVLAVPAGLLSWPAGVVLVCAAAALRWFFRDPERTPPADGGVVSPADGRVSVLREEPAEGVEPGAARAAGDDGPGERGDGADGGDSARDGDDHGAAEGDGPADGSSTRVRVGVFMSPADVHVNRAPLDGTVRSVVHEAGGHWPAFSKASERNERLHVEVDGDEDWRVTLVAGTVARRIHPYVSAGETLERGDRIGHISFGSRADVLLPPSVELADVAVERGETVRAGESVLVPGAALDATADGTVDPADGRNDAADGS